MKHRVLMITTVSGFLWQFERNTVELLQEAEAEIHFASNFDRPAYAVREGYFEENGIWLHPIPIEKSPLSVRANLRALRELRRIIRREQIDTIHCHTPMGGVLGRLASLAAGRKIPVIYTAHGFHFYKGAPLQNWLLYYPAERILARMTDSLVTINHEDEQAAGRFSLRRKGKVCRIPGVGVDTEKYAPRPELRREARKRLGVSEQEFCLLTAALLDREKNHATVLEMIRNSPEVSGRPICYCICGEGPYRGKLQKLAEAYGIRDQVQFLGYRNDLDVLLQGADLFVFPSLREGLGMAALEAMACGIPVAGAVSRGTLEYIKPGENGFLCRGSVPEDFARAAEALAEDPEMGRRMGAAAREESLRFDKKKAKGCMERIYQELWNRRHEDETEDLCDHECVQSTSVRSA